jgi:hypothetical protein
MTPVQKRERGNDRGEAIPETGESSKVKLMDSIHPNRSTKGRSSFPRYACHASDERPVRLSTRLIQTSGVRQTHQLEPDLVSRTELAQTVNVCRNNVREVRIAPHRSAGDAKDEDLSARNLDRSRGDRGGETIGFRDD